MNFNFDQVISRVNTNSVKYDENLANFGSLDVVPMWIADMDFKTAPGVIEAFSRRVNHGIFGYPSRSKEFFESFRDWQCERNGFSPDLSLVEFAPGVITGMTVALENVTEVNSRVLVLQPVYHQFANIVRRTGRSLVVSELVLDESGNYSIDFDDFESKLKDVDLFILCNPHNPIGKMWDRDILERIAELCLRYNVPVFSDEIHSDIILSDKKHICFASISDEVAKITTSFYAPTKTFNLAGVNSSFIVFPNSHMKELYVNFVNRYSLSKIDCFSLDATIASYRHGGAWLDELLVYLRGNVEFVRSFLDENIPSLRFNPPEATYLCWIDARELGISSDKLISFFSKNASVGFSNGVSFGKGGDGFFRMNIACPRSVIALVLEKMKFAIDDYLSR